MTQHIKFFSDNAVAVKYFPPIPASKAVPEWFKNLPLRADNEELTARRYTQCGNRTPMTIKGCVPVSDYLTSGYIIRAAADIVITPEKREENNGFWWSSPSALGCNAHTHEQCPVKINNAKNDYIKVLSSWRVVTPPGYSCYFYQSEFALNENIRFFPAVVDTDAYENTVHFPGVVVAKDTFTIKAGDPLMVVFPFKRQDWEHSIAESAEPPNPIINLLERGYKTLFHKPKRYH